MKIGILIPFRGTQKDKSRLRIDLDDKLVDTLLNKTIKHVLKEVSKLRMEKTIYILTKMENIDFDEINTILKDQSNDLNNAVEDAIKEIEEEIIVIIMADLPLIKTENIAEIISFHRMEGKIIIAPSPDNGTSIICFNKKIKFPFLFGKNSSLNFKENFKRNRRNFQLLNYEEAYKDIDTFKDLIELSKLNSIPNWLRKILQTCDLYE